MSIKNIFKKESKQSNSSLDMWLVEWNCFNTKNNVVDIVPRYQSFANKEEAENFADSIRMAHELIGNSGNTTVTAKRLVAGLHK